MRARQHLKFGYLYEAVRRERDDLMDEQQQYFKHCKLTPHPIQARVRATRQKSYWVIKMPDLFSAD